MKHTLHILLAASLLMLAGCGDAEEAPVEAPATDVAPAAEAGGEAAAKSEVDTLIDLAKAVRANPADTDKLLADAGMSIEQLETAMVMLAKDPAKAKAFTMAIQ